LGLDLRALAPDRSASGRRPTVRHVGGARWRLDCSCSGASTCRSHIGRASWFATARRSTTIQPRNSVCSFRILGSVIPPNMLWDAGRTYWPRPAFGRRTTTVTASGAPIMPTFSDRGQVLSTDGFRSVMSCVVRTHGLPPATQSRNSVAMVDGQILPARAPFGTAGTAYRRHCGCSPLVGQRETNVL
jgi:hypothetical protein